MERAFFLLLLHLLLPGEYCDAVGNVCYAFEGTPGTTEPRTGQRIPPIRDPERWSVRASKPAKDRRKGGSERASNRSWGKCLVAQKKKGRNFHRNGRERFLASLDVSSSARPVFTAFTGLLCPFPAFLPHSPLAEERRVLQLLFLCSLARSLVLLFRRNRVLGSVNQSLIEERMAITQPRSERRW